MPDIAMCGNDHCLLRQSCYRHEASGTRPTERRQSYMAFTFLADEAAERIYCSGYDPIHGLDPRFVNDPGKVRP